ncbi:McrC family protein [Paraferrimonas haliotis]|uniref:McrBC 5-methylcytosine restriction system component family protein n=1 Tax=Paraferrimonas haliotis TaxID=2013866 RepID=A0AA37WXS3_9GAMM|nr:McrC family protein [Paraferrimonas haliotis]GLS84692.1 mcrBC 5-methylcytosine restriction system component family protein [Paraferrimonas haliotis]
MHTTVFEFGYLSSDKQACDDVSAKLISQAAFKYLKEVSLSGDNTRGNQYLMLTKRLGHELIQVQNYVGVLFVPSGEQIEILPKIERESVDSKTRVEDARQLLLTMLAHLGTFRFITSQQANVAKKQMPMLEVFIEQFLQSVNKLVKRGLKNDYIVKEDNLSFQKGKLRVATHLRRNMVMQHRFYVNYDEYLLDRPANRIIKSALQKITSYTRIASNQKLLRELQFVFAEVSYSKSIMADTNALKLDRSTVDYNEPIAWAKLILNGFSPLSMQGDASALSLLFPMEAVFESYVASILSSQIGLDAELSTQESKYSLVTHKNIQQFKLKPDLLLSFNSGSQIVMDTKWKLLDLKARNYGIAQSDMYQMFAYGQKYLNGKGEMFLVYPAHPLFAEPIQHSFDFSESLKLWAIPFICDHNGDSRLIWPYEADCCDYFDN